MLSPLHRRSPFAMREAARWTSVGSRDEGAAAIFAPSFRRFEHTAEVG